MLQNYPEPPLEFSVRGDDDINAFYKRDYENNKSAVDVSIDKTLQKYPDLNKILDAWKSASKHIKQAIMALIAPHKEKWLDYIWAEDMLILSFLQSRFAEDWKLFLGEVDV